MGNLCEMPLFCKVSSNRELFHLFRNGLAGTHEWRFQWKKLKFAASGFCLWVRPPEKTCSAEPVPCCGRFCLFLWKHRAGPGLPQGGLPGWNLGSLWSPLSLANPVLKGRKLDLQRYGEHKHLRWDWIKWKLISESSEGRKSIELQKRNRVGKSWCYLVKLI